LFPCLNMPWLRAAHACRVTTANPPQRIRAACRPESSHHHRSKTRIRVRARFLIGADQYKESRST